MIIWLLVSSFCLGFHAQEGHGQISMYSERDCGNRNVARSRPSGMVGDGFEFLHVLDDNLFIRAGVLLKTPHHIIHVSRLE